MANRADARAARREGVDLHTGSKVDRFSELASGERVDFKEAMSGRVCRTYPIDREKFVREMASRLDDRSWMVDAFVTQPFLLKLKLSAHYKGWDGFRFDITRFLERGTDPARLVFLALYPSGAVRGLTTTTAREDDAIWVSLRDTSALLDPDLDSEEPPSRCQVKLVALEVPSL